MIIFFRSADQSLGSVIVTSLILRYGPPVAENHGSRGNFLFEFSSTDELCSVWAEPKGLDTWQFGVIVSQNSQALKSSR